MLTKSNTAAMHEKMHWNETFFVKQVARDIWMFFVWYQSLKYEKKRFFFFTTLNFIQIICQVLLNFVVAPSTKYDYYKKEKKINYIKRKLSHLITVENITFISVAVGHDHNKIIIARPKDAQIFRINFCTQINEH